MKIVVAAVGKLRMAATAELANEYEVRTRRFAPVEVVEVRDQRGSDPARVAESESGRLLDVLRPEDHVVLCDERGKQLTTKGLATLVEQRLKAGGRGRLVFVVGGAEGVDDRVRKRADAVLALSGLTFPHELARVILLEQIYRVVSLLHGHPYHREGESI